MRLRVIICAAILLCLAHEAGAVVPQDLHGATVVQQGQCSHNMAVYQCFIVNKNQRHYMVAVDKRGEVAIYELLSKETKSEYKENEFKLVWSRPDA